MSVMGNDKQTCYWKARLPAWDSIGMKRDRSLVLLTIQSVVRATCFLFLIGAILQVRSMGQELKDTPVPDSGVLLKAPLEEQLRSSLEQAMRVGNYTLAETLLVKEVEHHPKSPQLLTLLGHIFFLDGKYLNSAVAMKKAAALSPLDDRSRFTLAMSYIRLDRNDWARPELEKLVRSDPRKALYPYWLARLDYAAQQFNSAVTNLQRALDLEPGFTKAYDNLGLCYEALGKDDEAIRSYQEANRLNRLNAPNSPWPPLNLARLLVKFNRLEEAETYLRESLGYDKKFAKAHYQLGVVLEKQQKYAEAITELQQASISDPTYPEPHYVLSRIYRRQGETKNAETALVTFKKLKKDKRLDQLQ